MIDGQNLSDQTVGHKLMTYDSIWTIATGQRDYYITGCLFDYNYFKHYYEIINKITKSLKQTILLLFGIIIKMIAINLNKQQALDADPKTIQQINFTGNLA